MELDIDSVLKERKFFQKIKCGDDGKKDTPVPISNTEVKLLSADSSWGFPPVRVGRCHALYILWRFSSAGRAPALQAGGQRFDPVNLHIIKSD